MCVEGRQVLACPARMIRSFKKVAFTQCFEDWIRCLLAITRSKQSGQRQVQYDHTWLGQNRNCSGQAERAGGKPESGSQEPDYEGSLIPD